MALRRLLLAIVLLIALPVFSQQKIIPFAGNYGTFGKNGGFAGDGGAPTSAAFTWPCEIAFDAAGNMYIVDLWNERVRAINMQSTTQTLYGVSIGAHNIATVVGNGTACPNSAPWTCGDGGPATSGELKNPVAIAIDSSGNMYIGDQQNAAIRKITPGGTISTIVGVMQDENYFPTDNVPVSFACTAAGNASGGNTTYDCTLPSIPTNTTYIYVQGFSTAANNGRFQVAAGSDSSHLVLNNASGVAESHAATANWAALDFPQGIAFDAAGNIYIADTNNQIVRAVNNQGTTQTIMGVSIPSGFINTVVGNRCLVTGQTGCYGGDGGPATSASLNVPLGLGFDGSGNLYIADDLNNLIRKVTPAGVISTVAGGVASVAITNVSNAANVSTYTYTLTSGPALTVNSYITIKGCTTTANNNTFQITGLGAGTFTVANATGHTEAVTATGLSGVRNFSGDGGAATSATMNQPFDVKVDNSGNIYIADQANNLVREVSGGIMTTIAGDFAVYGTNGGFGGDGGLGNLAGIGCNNVGAGCIQGGVGPVGVTPDNLGHVFIGDTGNNVVRELLVIPNLSGGVTLSGGAVLK